MKKAAKPRAEEAFTRVDLLATVLVVMFLFSFPLLAVNRTHSQQQRAVDLNNLRQILSATALYSADNKDHLPHPTWGSLSGPDGWAYAVRNNGRISDAPPLIPNLGGSPDRSRQVPFFRIGQLGPYLKDDKSLECPKDITDRASGRGRILYLQRETKLTSYTANGAISGFGGRMAVDAVSGGTYQSGDFRPQDVIFWEVNESDPFNFNDAGSSPVNIDEGPSRRHAAASPNAALMPASGHALVGRVGGSAEFLPFKEVSGWQRTGGIGRPNEIFCGPGFRR